MWLIDYSNALSALRKRLIHHFNRDMITLLKHFSSPSNTVTIGTSSRAQIESHLFFGRHNRDDERDLLAFVPEIQRMPKARDRDVASLQLR